MLFGPRASGSLMIMSEPEAAVSEDHDAPLSGASQQSLLSSRAQRGTFTAALKAPRCARGDSYDLHPGDG